MKIENLSVSKIRSNLQKDNPKSLQKIKVSFDLTLSRSAWYEVTTLNVVSPDPTMQNIINSDITKYCSDLVDTASIATMERLKRQYIDICKQEELEPTNELLERKLRAYYKLMYNIPGGVEITRSISTDYKVLVELYENKETYSLEIRAICDKLLELPYFKDILDIRKGE